jgi:glycine/D-amino acid oxidase-like deaminating enzyme
MGDSSLTGYDVVVVGGGFFGCCLALHLEERFGCAVALVEREKSLLQRASYANQARVHNGYHYPRSFLTALRCRMNFRRFISDFRDCVVANFEKYYAIGKNFSKVTARQYREFCSRIGAPLSPAPTRIRKLFDPHLIEDVFAVEECAFDAVKLARMIEAKLRQSKIELYLETEATRVERLSRDSLEVLCRLRDREFRLRGRRVFNCTYSRLNWIAKNSDLPQAALKHEMTEMALVEVPDELRGLGITVMCGPFFSIMPFPPLGLHTLSHVRYTPHCEWFDGKNANYLDPYAYWSKYPRRSRFEHMIRDAARYLPALRGCRYQGSIWEVKTVLPQSEVDDSRPILWFRHGSVPELVSVMGGKLDNIYDVLDVLEEEGVFKGAGRR